MPAAGRRRRRALWAVALLVLAAGGAGAWLVWGGAAARAAPEDLGPTAVVSRGPLVVSVTESGEVEAEKRKVISNELQWPVIIKTVVEEGERVAKGDTLIVFECKELIDAIESKEITVTNAENAYTQAREGLVLKRKEVANSVRKAEQALLDANSDLQRYIEAAGPTKISDADSKIHTAQRDLALAEDKLNFKLKVNADDELKSPFSKNDIEAERLSVEKLKLALQKAINERDMLIKYDHPQEVRKLEMGVEDARLALARAQLEARSQILQSEADETAKKATFEMQSRKLGELKKEAEKLVVKADEEGLVVYDTGGRWWRDNNVTIEVGEKISPRQQLMIIPDMGTLQIETKVFEAIIDQVTVGLPAYVRLDSKPDLTLPGRLTKVGVLPDSQHRWLNPGVKVFSVIVNLDDPIDGLKPGMTCKVEIELARMEDVLSVPIAAVFTEQEETFCYRVEDGRVRRSPVRVGRMNDARVQVLEGLAAGDRVLLAPPEGTELDAPDADANTPAEKPKHGRRARRPRPSGQAGSGSRE